VTVYDFIVIYNETFKYIEDRYGVEALKDLWRTINEQFCVHLDRLVREQGLAGFMEYWNGTDGTLGREKADYQVCMNDWVFAGYMHNCPSVGELKHAGRKIYNGKLCYCDHCPALYAPVAAKYGYKMLFDISRDDTGQCLGKCFWTAFIDETSPFWEKN
jgi:hypothetical protein